MVRRISLILFCIGILWAESSDGAVHIPGLPPVPNPYGFDDRLALRTYLEDTYNRKDLAERNFDELVAIYRAVTAPPTVTAPVPVPEAQKSDEAAEHERLRRDNIILQLRRQYHLTVDDDSSTADLEQQLRDCQVTDQRVRSSAGAQNDTTQAETEDAESASAVATKPVTTAAPAKLLRVREIVAADFVKPAGIISGLVVDNNGDRLVGISFNASLSGELELILSYAAGTMAASNQAKTCLVLLGHGDGAKIGMGDQPVDLSDHIKANRESYHTLLGTKKIDCVAILSCSRESYKQFTAFRDGLGYYPTWRVSAWEHSYQNAISGLSALQLTLAQDRNANFRAAVYYGDMQEVASLAEVGQRVPITYFACAQSANGMVLTPLKRK